MDTRLPGCFPARILTVALNISASSSAMSLTDTFRQVGGLRQLEQLGQYLQFLRQLLDGGEVDTMSIYRKALPFCRPASSEDSLPAIP